jgi:replicative superfamily II helicase
MEKISWVNRVRNEEVLQRVKGERNVLRTIKREANWIGNILHRKCLLKHIRKEKIYERYE